MYKCQSFFVIYAKILGQMAHNEAMIKRCGSWYIKQSSERTIAGCSQNWGSINR
jgi:hypothetical protein